MQIAFSSGDCPHCDAKYRKVDLLLRRSDSKFRLQKCEPEYFRKQDDGTFAPVTRFTFAPFPPCTRCGEELSLFGYYLLKCKKCEAVFKTIVGKCIGRGFSINRNDKLVMDKGLLCEKCQRSHDFWQKQRGLLNFFLHIARSRDQVYLIYTQQEDVIPASSN